jgi:hypothetical protein
LKATGFALPCTPPSESSNGNGSSRGGANIDTDVSAFSEIFPFF